MEPAATLDVAARSARFAEQETTRHSAVYTAWALGLSSDPETCALISTRPPRERQPNLVFAAARFVDPALVPTDQTEPRPDEYGRFRDSLHAHWAEVVAVMANHHTQTNEAARAAVLLPAVDKVVQNCGKPVALIEFGASAGLVLNPEQFRIHYVNRAGQPLATLSHDRVPTPVGEVTVRCLGSTACPQGFPQIGWRLGVDINPLQPFNPDDVHWLRTLIWPGQVDRLARLDAALEAFRRNPVRVLPRDITRPGVLDEVLRLVPRDVEPVIVHSAVLAYLEEDERAAFADRMLAAVAEHRCHWISNEGQQVVPQIADAFTTEFREGLRKGAFVIALDGVPQYQGDGHAGWIL
ncbi:DUF2332 domain-containing protein [Aestuariimicrobium sp. T2.26MG-19.2B]|uniref:DUF2332 domain-containing protein n=1 Tax=Aestuariimicrobium sp. T2.26MG-19.2B TaxID=3040679 RepID=UPI0024779E50|nr:DUF2332 domain-containing protein [Aestuariimicrobium sp. T2.26MG-19.2B]CAI9403439.1 hypothetical protein AESSP_01004 [Aestuariimicrobium sp. T2.26MG-19.2B]